MYVFEMPSTADDQYALRIHEWAREPLPAQGTRCPSMDDYDAVPPPHTAFTRRVDGRVK